MAIPKIYETNIVATDVSEEDFLANYEGHYEWVDGKVFDMAPVSSTNMNLQKYLMFLIDSYFSYRPIGQQRFDPFTMRLEGISNRQPDIQVILGDNQENLGETYMNGPADIVIEIVSPKTAIIDRGIKFQEYQDGKVPEYWIIDPKAKEALFYRLSEEGHFIAQKVVEDTYTTEQLPKLKLYIPTLWEKQHPNMQEILEAVKAMLDN